MDEILAPQQVSEELLDFFRALADANRLKIVGLLAQKTYSVEQLADTLGLGVSTTSHHLAKLAKVGLVNARTEGHYYFYSLQTDVLTAMAQRLLSKDTLPRLTQDAVEDTDAFDRKVIRSFVDEDGRINAFPAQEKKFFVLLRYMLNAFEPGQQYTEKQVNEVLLRFNQDTASIRRGMIDYHLMERERGGGSYWRVDGEVKP